MQRVYRKFFEAYRDVLDADVLLFPRRSLISIFGRGEHSHAGLAGWWRDDLMLLDVREWRGGGAVRLWSEVRRRSRGVDVYRPQFVDSYHQRTLKRDQIVAKMRKKTGKRYGYAAVLSASCLHLLGVRLVSQADTEDGPKIENRFPEFCSQAISNAFRTGADLDLVPGLADHHTEPTDLARSALLEYRFTLVA